MAESPWPWIHGERAALAADLASLSDEEWRSPSLCSGWTVQQALAHMTATARMTPPKFFLKFARAGFRFPVMTARDIAEGAQGSPQECLAAFRAEINSTSAPPGPADSWLGETIVHGEDIRRPLDIAHKYPPEALVRVADFYKKSNALIGSKNRIAGLRLTATDTEWSTGDGPEVAGTMLSLVMAMTGRSAALSDLSGDGVSTLRTRTHS